MPYDPPAICYVVRHGETDDNVCRRWGGGDPALNPKGRQEAQSVCADLAAIKFDRAFASKAMRTKETAEIILNNRPIELKRKKKFSEIKIGPFEGMYAPDIIDYFCKATGYPDPSTKEKLPKLWAKLNGAPIENANDCLLDPWSPEDTDTFDGFSKECVKKITKTARKYPAQNLLFVTHSTVIKSLVAAAAGVPVDPVKNTTGCWVAIVIDHEGKMTLIPGKMKGISF